MRSTPPTWRPAAATWLALAALTMMTACPEGGGGTKGDVTTECEGEAPDCPSVCGSDGFFPPAVCEDGAWVCASGGVLMTTCPPGTCWGSPLPGEICDDGWACAPGAAAIESCPELMCATCRGFAGPVEEAGCRCQCDESSDTVVCEATPVTCAGAAPLCAPGCGGDSFHGPAECVDGAWTCAEGILRTDCPPGTCWGEKAPGEVCTEAGWSCQPSADDYAACPDVLCLTCDGFAGPVEQAGCSCECSEGNVVCEATPTTCEASAASTLPGVTIVLSSAACTFTLAEAAAGIAIPYSVVVTQPVAGVLPRPQDSGQCGQPGPSGLIVFERLTGGDEGYCICDTGLCMGPSDEPVDLDAGVYPGSFAWDGHNWAGPSDTGNPKGAPFPPGDYVLTVSAKGELAAGDEPFEVVGTMTLHLVE